MTNNIENEVERMKKDIDLGVMVDDKGFIYVKKDVLFKMIDTAFTSLTEQHQREKEAIVKDLKNLLMTHDTKDGYSELFNSVLEELYRHVERITNRY